MEKGMIVKKCTQSGFCFDLVAADGLVLCRSEAYATDEACADAIGQLRAVCGAPVEDHTREDFVVLPFPKYEMHKNEAGEYTFLLKGIKGTLIARGPVFRAAYTCRQGIAQMAGSAANAELVVLTHTGKPATGQAFRT